MEKCKERDLLENMLAEMAGEFPALSRVFVTERDLFLAHSLQMVIKIKIVKNIFKVIKPLGC